MDYNSRTCVNIGIVFFGLVYWAQINYGSKEYKLASLLLLYMWGVTLGLITLLRCNIDPRGLLGMSENSLLTSVRCVILLSLILLSATFLGKALGQSISQLFYYVLGFMVLWDGTFVKKITVSVLTALFAEPTFAVTWGTDQLVSLSSAIKIAVDVALKGLSQIQPHSVPLVVFFAGIVPHITRGIQCIKQCFSAQKFISPNFFNLLKYLTSIANAFIGYQYSTNSSLFLLFLAGNITNTLFALYWDIFHDFGLLSDGFWLRRKTLFSGWVYFCIVLLDVFMRLFWVAPLVTIISLNPEQMQYTTAAVEILRRSLWNLLRLQNQVQKKIKLEGQQQKINHKQNSLNKNGKLKQS